MAQTAAGNPHIKSTVNFFEFVSDVLKSSCLIYRDFSFFGATAPQWARASTFTKFLDHTHDAPQSVGLLWAVISSKQRLLPDNTQHSQQTNIHAPGGIRIHKLSRRAAADPRLRPSGHSNRLTVTVHRKYYKPRTSCHKL
jgi:hypothetical protein